MLKRLYDKLVKKGNTSQTTDSSNLVKKADYNKKISKIEMKILDHDKYITTQKLKNFAPENFVARLA